jgi:hypothetical protein
MNWLLGMAINSIRTPSAHPNITPTEEDIGSLKINSDSTFTSN